MTTRDLVTLHRALLGALFALGLAACDDDADEAATTRSSAREDAGAKSAASDAARRGGEEEMAAKSKPPKGGAPAPTISKEVCELGARNADASPECVGCFCEAVANCGTACQAVLVCFVTRCASTLDQPAEAARCALRECASDALQAGGIAAVGDALTAFSACGAACTPEAPAAPPRPTTPPPPPATAPIPPTPPAADLDAGSDDDASTSTDAGN